MKITREQAITEHRKMWNWISDETEKRKAIVEKREYLQKYSLHAGSNDCFLCMYSNPLRSIFNGNNPCAHCPLDWDSLYDNAMCADKRTEEDGYYSIWSSCCDENNWEGAALYARMIANLKERL